MGTSIHFLSLITLLMQILGSLMQGAAGNHSSAQVQNGCIEKVCVYIAHMLQPLASTQAPRPRVGGTEVIQLLDPGLEAQRLFSS